MEAATAEQALQLAAAEGLTIVPSSRSQTGFKCVQAKAGSNTFRSKVFIGHKDGYKWLGSASTAEGAALLYARFLGPEASAAEAAEAAAAAVTTAAAAPLTAEEALQLAAAEGLTLVRSSQSHTGYMGVTLVTGKHVGSSFRATIKLDGADEHLGTAPTAEGAALLFAPPHSLLPPKRHEGE